MKSTLRRSLLATAGSALAIAMASPAFAQVQPTPPDHYAFDDRGVDLVSGSFVYTETDLVIGQPGEGGLQHGRVYINGGWRDTLSGTVAVSGNNYTVSFGPRSERFTKSGSVFVPVSNNGSTLTQNGTLLTFTTSDGAVARYLTSYSGSISAYEANNAALTDVTYPNGEQHLFSYEGVSVCQGDPEIGCTLWQNFVRLETVRSNAGYQINFLYASNDAQQDAYSWLIRTGAVGFNLAKEYCANGDNFCTLTGDWPRVTYQTIGTDLAAVTDQSGRTTSYTYSQGRLTGVKRPGSATNDIDIAYSGRVSSVTDQSGAWTYAYSLSGGVLATTASGPLGQQLTAAANTSIGRVTSLTDALNNTWSYQYDGQRRLSRATAPEGDYVHLTYDARGNVNLTTFGPKTGSAEAAITTSASFPASCTNMVTCNLPTSFTDANGKVTDYTYDPVHGGVLTILEPAATPGAVRPETRIAYAPQQAQIKGPSGTIIPLPGQQITRPVSISSCATTASCAGTADEVRVTLAYGSVAVPNNLLISSSSRGSGADPSMAVTTMTYTDSGDLATVDGPLAGAADTTRYRYDDNRQLVGVVGPDPDGAGSGLPRAMRISRNARDQVTLRQAGTVADQTDQAWAAFNPALGIQSQYDAKGRLIRTEQSGTGSGVNLRRDVSHDVAGRPACVTLRMNPAATAPGDACTPDAAGAAGPDRITQIAYDAAGRQSAVTVAAGLPDSATQSTTYSPNGELATLTDGNGNVSIFERDGHDRLSRLRYPNPSGGGTSATDYESYGYDAGGHVTSIRNRAGAVTTRTFDGQGRLTAIDAPAGTPDTTIAYDNIDRPTSVSLPGQTLTLAYDALSRRTSESDVLGSVNYQHNPAGEVTKITWPSALYVDYDRDLYGAVTRIRANGATSGPGVLATYSYNQLGQPTAIARGNGASTTFGYDGFSRTSSFAHDLAGVANDVSVTMSFNPANQITQRVVSNASYVGSAQPSATYGKDGLNRITTVNGTSVSYDGNRNMTGIGSAIYGFDSANRLTSSPTSTFGYDAIGRLHSASSPAVRFQYADQRIIAEVDNGGTPVARHVPGAFLDETVVSYPGANLSNPQWNLTDERGSVIAVSDGNAASLGVNTYDEYGVPAPGNIGRFQYAGQPWLGQAAVYHNRARAYHPQTGRFLQPDPIGYAAGSNLYAYVSADPINQIDPSGTCPPCFGGLVGGLISGGIELYSQAHSGNYDMGKIAIQTGIGAVAGATGAGIGLLAGRVLAPVAAQAFGGAIGGAFGSGTSSGVSAAWQGKSPGEIARAAGESAAWGAGLGALGGAVASKVGATPEFRRALDGFKPLVQWQPRTYGASPSVVGTALGEFGGGLISSGYDFYNLPRPYLPSEWRPTISWSGGGGNCHMADVGGTPYIACTWVTP